MTSQVVLDERTTCVDAEGPFFVQEQPSLERPLKTTNPIKMTGFVSGLRLAYAGLFLLSLEQHHITESR